MQIKDMLKKNLETYNLKKKVQYNEANVKCMTRPNCDENNIRKPNVVGN